MVFLGMVVVLQLLVFKESLSCAHILEYLEKKLLHGFGTCCSEMTGVKARLSTNKAVTCCCCPSLC